MLLPVSALASGNRHNQYCWPHEKLNGVGPVDNRPSSTSTTTLCNLFLGGGGIRYIFFKASALWADAFYKLICPSVCPSVCRSVCPSVCAFTFEVPFKRLFTPTSQNQMSNIFRVLESFGKSNGKKWSQISTFLFWNGLKSPNKKIIFFFADFASQTLWKPCFQID